jgi:protein-S-isoprenylcysteine O-methyltransferase Ste14
VNVDHEETCLMNLPVLLLIVLNFALIGVLPRIFFRNDGRLNARWWATALPFCVVPAFLVAGSAAGLTPLTPRGWLTATAMISVALSAASIGLICLTLGTHRIPIALWHQDSDAPEHIVTYGAYRWIRHPFYAAFILAFCSAVFFLPHLVTLGALCYALVALNVTARREERRLAGSAFGSQYRQYLGRTGRFVPRLGTK